MRFQKGTTLIAGLPAEERKSSSLLLKGTSTIFRVFRSEVQADAHAEEA